MVKKCRPINEPQYHREWRENSGGSGCAYCGFWWHRALGHTLFIETQPAYVASYGDPRKQVKRRTRGR